MRHLLLICLLLAIVTAILYGPALRADFINFDDKDYVTENGPVRAGLSWKGVAWALTARECANWHPLTWLSHMTDCELFGLKAQAHHLVNVLLHIANSILLLIVLRAMTGKLWPSAIVAALFAWHPMHVESVAWISERKDLLSTLFLMLTLWAYLRFVQRRTNSLKPGTGVPRSSAWLYYTLALLAFVLGLMSKPMLVTLPFVLLLLDFWPLHRWKFATGPAAPSPGATLSSLLIEKVPFFLLSAASSVVTFVVQRGGGAMSTWDALPLTQRIPNALVSYLRYLLKLLWPIDLSVYYPHPGSWPAWQVIIAALVLLAVSAFAVQQYKTRPYLATGWFWFLGTLVPVIGIVQVGGQALADRYTYIPSIGLFLMLTWLGLELMKPNNRPVIVFAVCLLLAGCAWRTRVQAAYWQDSERLFRQALRTTGGNYMIHFCLANALIDNGDVQQGLEHLRISAQLNPSFANAHGKLGYLAALDHRFSEAIAHYQQALKQRPDFPDALNNLAWLLATAPEATFRNGPAAVELAEKACRLTDYRRTLFIGTLAAAYAEAGRMNDAIATAEKAIEVANRWGETALAQRNQELLALYRAGKPFHEPNK
jgi:hypothetical protein